jgi:nucleoside-diphosphate-sugar epimerase
MHVFVAGGTGVIGRRLIPQLVARGHRVTATSSNASKLAALKALGAEPVLMNGLDAKSVRTAVTNPDVIVHEMTAISGKPDMRHMDRWFALTNRLRIEGTDHLVATGIPVIAQSYGAWNGLREGGWVKTEEDPLDSLAGTSAAPNMAAIQYLETAVVGAGGAALRYGALYGPGATDDQVDLVRKRMFPLVGKANGYTSWVHVDDAASATVLAVERHAKGIFDICDDEPAPANEWLPYLAKCADAKPPHRIPKWLARLLAGEVVVKMMTEGRGFSNAKAKAQLGWRLRYPSWRDGFSAITSS